MVGCGRVMRVLDFGAWPHPYHLGLQSDGTPTTMANRLASMGWMAGRDGWWRQGDCRLRVNPLGFAVLESSALEPVAEREVFRAARRLWTSSSTDRWQYAVTVDDAGRIPLVLAGNAAWTLQAWAAGRTTGRLASDCERLASRAERVASSYPCADPERLRALLGYVDGVAALLGRAGWRETRASVLWSTLRTIADAALPFAAAYAGIGMWQVMVGVLVLWVILRTGLAVVDHTDMPTV